MPESRLLYLLSLAESTLPIGGLAHSFGLETLVTWDVVSPESLQAYLHGWIQDGLRLDGAYARLAASERDTSYVAKWQGWNDELSALKLSSESRDASLRLGGRLMRLGAALVTSSSTTEKTPFTPDASMFLTELSARDSHHCLAFGLLASCLEVDANTMLCAYLNQSVTSLVSAAQRLLPLGQMAATALIWQTKPQLSALIDELETTPASAIGSFMPLAEIGAMQHRGLDKRMFLS